MNTIFFNDFLIYESIIKKILVNEMSSLKCFIIKWLSNFHCNGQGRTNIIFGEKPDVEPNDFGSTIIVGGEIIEENEPLINVLRERLSKSRLEVKDILDSQKTQRNKSNKDKIPHSPVQRS